MQYPNIRLPGRLLLWRRLCKKWSESMYSGQFDGMWMFKTLPVLISKVVTLHVPTRMDINKCIQNNEMTKLSPLNFNRLSTPVRSILYRQQPAAECGETVIHIHDLVINSIFQRHIYAVHTSWSSSRLFPGINFTVIWNLWITCEASR